MCAALGHFYPCAAQDWALIYNFTGSLSWGFSLPSVSNILCLPGAPFLVFQLISQGSVLPALLHTSWSCIYIWDYEERRKKGQKQWEFFTCSWDHSSTGLREWFPVFMVEDACLKNHWCHCHHHQEIAWELGWEGKEETKKTIQGISRRFLT